jgi:hypothetical protein
MMIVLMIWTAMNSKKLLRTSEYQFKKKTLIDYLTYLTEIDQVALTTTNSFVESEYIIYYLI